MQKPVNRNVDARFITVQMAMEHFNLCRSSVMKLAKEAGGLIKAYGVVRIDVEKCDNYLVSQYTE